VVKVHVRAIVLAATEDPLDSAEGESKQMASISEDDA
jgi:hypothetical protein